MIEIEGLSKCFGDLTAVNDISLSVPRGEFFVILGPNAAGKTTTIKVMAGLMRPTKGSVHICGYNIELDPLDARKRMAYLPDFPFLYDKLTPSEFFRFTGQLFGMAESDIKNESEYLSDRFSLGEFLSKPIESLSHGTKQRVAIVSALMHAPEVFVLDEPMVGLDPHHARVLKDILRERADQGMTVFVSTHQLSVAEEMADRIGIMNQGRIVAVGSHSELQAANRDSKLESIFLSLTTEADG
ncbi:MAG: ABC transporter ATP-binding protein [Verrucomicrobiota bacterium]|jgi:ABC-2 type transport system ATP-binding protein|nr:ABC transporter ATP-binding protein [Verrucomicrobiota bacterium]MEE2614792.1 ABC transporter ATP-binding protein [Verrucomicrobiota bacterium]